MSVEFGLNGDGSPNGFQVELEQGETSDFSLLELLRTQAVTWRCRCLAGCGTEAVGSSVVGRGLVEDEEDDGGSLGGSKGDSNSDAGETVADFSLVASIDGTSKCFESDGMNLRRRTGKTENVTRLLRWKLCGPQQ